MDRAPGALGTVSGASWPEILRSRLPGVAHCNSARQVAGRRQYLYRAVDQYRLVIVLAEQRDIEAARRFSIRSLAGVGPAIVARRGGQRSRVEAGDEGGEDPLGLVVRGVVNGQRFGSDEAPQCGLVGRGLLDGRDDRQLQEVFAASIVQRSARTLMSSPSADAANSSQRVAVKAGSAVSADRLILPPLHTARSSRCRSVNR